MRKSKTLESITRWSIRGGPNEDWKTGHNSAYIVYSTDTPLLFNMNCGRESHVDMIDEIISVLNEIKLLAKEVKNG